MGSRFHPLVQSTGTLVLDGKVIDLAGEACFIHAIQGMRPDSVGSFTRLEILLKAPARRLTYSLLPGGTLPSLLLAAARLRASSVKSAPSRWSLPLQYVHLLPASLRSYFANISADRAHHLWSQAVYVNQQDSYGPKGAKSGRTVVSVGAVYSSALGQPLIAVGQTSVPTDPSAFPSKSGEVCSATQLNPIKDSFTGYSAPGGIEFAWAGKQTEGGKGQVEAKVHVDKLGITDGEGGLIEKVDVLAEIPYVIRKTLAAVTGTKPYIYQVCGSHSRFLWRG